MREGMLILLGIMSSVNCGMTIIAQATTPQPADSLQKSMILRVETLRQDTTSTISPDTLAPVPSLTESGDKEVMLKEFVVEAASRKDIDQGVAFYPTKNVRNLATDGVNLIQMMALTELPYDYRKGMVTDASGQSVTYFINGQEATTKELKAMNPRDIDRVEYFPMPTDGRFHGKQNVVNYVTKKYETGGFTRLKALQYLDGRYGDYTLSSRFAHKEMTFDLFIDGDYVNRVNTGSVLTNTFKEITYSDAFYDILTQTLDNSRNRRRQNDLGAYLKALWSHRAITFSATAGWNRTEQPSYSNLSATTFTPAAISSSYIENSGTSLNINPYAKVMMQLSLPHSQTISVSLNGRYAAEKNASLYAPEGLASIYNASRDRSWSLMALADYSRQLNARNSIGVSAYIVRGVNRTTYQGSFDGFNLYRSLSLQASASYSHTFRKGTYLSLSAGFNRESRKVNGREAPVQWSPSASLNFSHKWNTISNFNLSSNTFSMGYTGNVMNDVIIRTSELIWKRGNPQLKNRLWWQTSVSNTWNPTASFSVTLRTIYTRIFHKDNEVWEAADGYDGLVSYLSSAGNADKITAGARVTLKLFNKKLVLTGDIDYTFLRLTGQYRRSNSYTGGSFSATWYGRQWYVSGVLVPGATSSADNGITEVYKNWDYSVAVGFNRIRSLNLRLQVTNPFGASWTSITKVDTEHFSRRSQGYSCFAANRFTITAIYTLSYGKKVTKVNMVKDGDLDSGAMKTD